MFMSCVRKCIAIIVAGACQLAFASDWYVYESEHFRLVADKKRKQVSQELSDLEIFRQATLAFTGIEHLDEKNRLTILILSQPKNYLTIFPEKRAAGFYIDSFGGPYMVVGPSQSLEDTAITLRHEYVHHLLHSASERVYPKWYDEGLADFLSTAKIYSNSVAIGAPHPWRSRVTKLGQMLSFNDLITPSNFLREGTYGELYYSTAWLAAHYFILGQVNGVDIKGANLNRYLEAFNLGYTSPFKFEMLIGRDIQSLNSDLKSYAKLPQYSGFRLPVEGYNHAITTSRLSENQQLMELGGVGLALDRMAAVIEIAHRKKKGEQVESVQAMQYFAQLNDNATAVTEDQLLKLNPMEAWGKAMLAGAIVLRIQAESSEALISRATDLANQCLDRQPYNLYAREALWQIATLKGESDEAIKQLKIAYGYMPANIGIAMELASQLLLKKRYNEAKPLIEKVLLWAHDSDMAEKAAALMQQLNESAE